MNVSQQSLHGATMCTSTIFQMATLFIVLTRHLSESKNVVFLPVAATSHARLHAFTAEELAKMGHKVWVALPTALYNRNAENYQGVTTFKYEELWEPNEEQSISRLEATFSEAITTGTEPNWDWVWKFCDEVSEVYFKAMSQGKFIEFLESLHPDLLVLDWFPNVDERVAAAYKLKVPFAVLSALQDPVTARIPFNPMAEAYNSRYVRTKANIFEKLTATFQIMTPLFLHLFNDKGYVQKLFPTDPNAPSANELMSQAEVYIIESDPVFDFPRPMLPNVKLIGGVSVSPAKELREPFKSFVERSEKAGVGVAVLSFGSLFMNLPKAAEIKIVTALRRIKLNTIWIANITSPDPEKILTSTWLPVNDLLGHRNVKVFISHAGTHSLYEAIYHAVPTVCLPLFYDQHINAERVEDKGYCINLDIIKTTADELSATIEKVASSTEMRSTIGTASDIYRQLYKNPRQEAAFWLDHVMRYGGSYMRYSGQKIPMLLFIMDYILVFFAGAAATSCFLLIFYLFAVAFSLYFRRNNHFKSD
ncbi:hypothetical protein BsWGS_13361 [Bradybaena similaris]